jgi:hypothetical protein
MLSQTALGLHLGGASVVQLKNLKIKKIKIITIIFKMSGG